MYRTDGIIDLHVRFAAHLPEGTARGVLQGYRNRYAVLRDAVLETEPTFREDLLAAVPVENLLGGMDKLNRKLERARSGQSTGRASGALATFEITRPTGQGPRARIPGG